MQEERKRYCKKKSEPPAVSVGHTWRRAPPAGWQGPHSSSLRSVRTGKGVARE